MWLPWSACGLSRRDWLKWGAACLGVRLAIWSGRVAAQSAEALTRRKRDFLKRFLYTRDDLDACLAGKGSPFSRYDAELGYVHAATALVGGVWGALALLPGGPRSQLRAAPATTTEPAWYYHEGPLAGSLKSDQPLALYNPDPNHLWNRLFAVLYIRPSELPGRPEYPKDLTQLDA
jgi:hypothetical protein